MLSNFRKNSMGTVSFDGQFEGMRKPQDFDVYPLNGDSDPEKLVIQSDTRYGWLFLEDGKVFMSPSVSSGAYRQHLVKGKYLTPISAAELKSLKEHVAATASARAGTNGMISCDNSQARAICMPLMSIADCIRR